MMKSNFEVGKKLFRFQALKLDYLLRHTLQMLRNKALCFDRKKSLFRSGKLFSVLFKAAAALL